MSIAKSTRINMYILNFYVVFYLFFLLFWLIEKTGCVLTDYNNSIGMKMTPAQQTVFDMMRKHGVLTDDYYDLTKQREKVREAREQKENRKQ